MIATAKQVTTGSKRVDMAERILAPGLTFIRQKRVSPYERCRQEWGMSHEKTARDYVATAVRRLTQAVIAFAEAEDFQKASWIVATIESPLVGTVPALPHALHAAERADCLEDVEEEEYRANPCADTARKLVAKKAAQISHEQKAIAALKAQWGV